MLLEKDNYVSIHYRNVQFLATEMYKVSKGLSPPLVSDLFKQKDGRSKNLRYNPQFLIPLFTTIFLETRSISCLSPIIWDIHHLQRMA